MKAASTFREIVIFLPYDGPASPRPMDLGHDLIAALGVEHAAFGTDVLTGSVEIRLPYDAGIVVAARQALTKQTVPFEIEVR